MKPRQTDEVEPPKDTPKETLAKTTASPKKKQPSSTSVAGRKIARKTAHSLIERRRRSKMNEEFGVLKDMIPACTGEMHKLAILQVPSPKPLHILQSLTHNPKASIDYVRYLEDCVTKLKAETHRTTNNSTPLTEQFHLPPPSARRSSHSHHTPRPSDNDIEMGNSSTHPSPTSYTAASLALNPQDSWHRQDSYSSDHHRHYSFSSATTSPALGPSAYNYGSLNGSALTSPALAPQRDLDQEATAALLMLNTDRRGTQARGGMSVKDLLST